ncbi:MAG TPA: serine acetyltransferase [Thermoleophilia bacterium]
MSWLSEYRADVARYTSYTKHPGAQDMVTQQALWALLQYRLASAAYRSSLPPGLRLPLLVVLYAWRKVIEVTTGICLPQTAVIGPGLYIAHFGPIIFNKRVVMGAVCDVHQGVTIGVSARGGRSGVPVIGERVWIGPNSTLAGPIAIGDHVMISANSLVVRDVPSHTVVRGVPAEVIGSR